jgi:uncharacterized protein (DUF58 family)
VPLPTRRLVAAVALVAVALLAVPGERWWVFGAVNALLAVALVADRTMTVAPDRLPVTRQLPPALALGEAGSLVWTVTNPTDRPLHVSVADELAPSLHAGRRRFTVDLAPRAQATVRTGVRPARRGRFDPTDVTVRVAGPLGLVARQATRSLPGELRVLPAFPSRGEAELRVNRARVLEVGLRSVRGHGGGTDFEQLREYRADDEFRRIDWSATARAERPVVRQYRAERNQTVLVLLDNGRTMAGQVAGVPRVEHAMDAAMMVTAVATRLGDRTGLVAFDRHVRAVVPPSAQRSQLGAVTAALFDLEPALAESDFHGAFTHAVARFRRRSLIVVLTELAEAAVTETLLPALPVVARQHLVLVGAVRDPEVAAMAGRPVHEPADAYGRVAALDALERRRRTVHLLRAAGATVVDALPGRLAPELTDAYLSFKATGRL